MKVKLLIATIVLLTSSVSLAHEHSNIPQGSTGFSGPMQGFSTVKQALDAGMFSNHTPVILTGQIKAFLGDENYLFSDSTGEITVEIDHDKWLGQSATPATNVQIVGELYKHIFGVKIDVDAIKVL